MHTQCVYHGNHDTGIKWHGLGVDGHARLPRCWERSHGPRVGRHADLFFTGEERLKYRCKWSQWRTDIFQVMMTTVNKLLFITCEQTNINHISMVNTLKIIEREHHIVTWIFKQLCCKLMLSHFSHVQLFCKPMGFSQQEYLSGSPFPSPMLSRM